MAVQSVKLNTGMISLTFPDGDNYLIDSSVIQDALNDYTAKKTVTVADYSKNWPEKQSIPHK